MTKVWESLLKCKGKLRDLHMLEMPMEIHTTNNWVLKQTILEGMPWINKELRTNYAGNVLILPEKWTDSIIFIITSLSYVVLTMFKT